ncbi:MAG: sulfurtransferase [Thiohalomonadales bacterium]
MVVMSDTYAHPEYLVETDWLELHLGDSDLRIFDCSVNVIPNPDHELTIQAPFVFQSGRGNFEQSHIPHSGFIDILQDLSDTSSTLPLMMPAEKQFVEAMSNYGISYESHVVLYSTTEHNWAARVWCMLREFGFNNVAILNGGWSKWSAENSPLSNRACAYQSANFIASSNSEVNYFVNKDTVLSAIDDENVRIINALPVPIHNGSSDIYFGRRGRITNSVNVPFPALHNPESGVYLAANELHQLYQTVNADQAQQIISYCGGGIASSNTVFTLALLGYENISLYDGSMLEWGNDPSLPMEMG